MNHFGYFLKSCDSSATYLATLPPIFWTVKLRDRRNPRKCCIVTASFVSRRGWKILSI